MGKQIEKSIIPASLLRLRAIALGILLIPLDNYWVIQMEKVLPGPYPTTISLFANAIFILAILVLLNELVKRVSARFALSQAELLAVYTMVCIGAALAGHDFVPILVQMMGHPFWFATDENQWMKLFGAHLPKWAMVSDKETLASYYGGNSTLYTSQHILAWIGPVLWWCLFIAALIFVMMCVNTIVRKQWIERERLTFPIVQLPLAMTEQGGAIWRNWLFWIGFIIAGGIDINNGLAALVPAIPEIVVKHTNNLASNLTTKPFNAIGWMPMSFYPFVIGLGFLLPADLLFSCWFFYIFWKLQMVFSSAMAWDAIPEFPFIKQQTFGGYAAVLVMLVWSGRGYLKQVWLKIVGKQSELDDSGEAMSYRTAAVGCVLGIAGLTAFFTAIGLSPFLGVISFLIYFLLSTAIARMRAELGPPVHDLHFIGPDEIVTQALGTANINEKNLTGLSFFYFFNRAYRGHPIAFGIESLKMAQVTRSSQRRFLLAIMTAAVVGSLASFWAYLHSAYILGCSSKFAMGTGFGHEPFSRLSDWILNRKPPNIGANLAMVFGFVFCLFLGSMRLKMFGWPFHPIGYAISGSWSMNLVWMPLMLAWIIKITVLKFGGLRFYKRALPFFLGLIMGQMIIGSIWSLIGIIFNIPTYSFWGG